MKPYTHIHHHIIKKKIQTNIEQSFGKNNNITSLLNKWKKYIVHLLLLLGTSRNLDLVLLLLFSKELSLQYLQKKEMTSREKVGGLRVPIPLE